MGVQISEHVIYGWSHNGAVFPPDEKTARQFAFGSNPRGGGEGGDAAVKNCLPLCFACVAATATDMRKVAATQTTITVWALTAFSHTSDQLRVRMLE